MRYGLPYKGSKNAIAEWIVANLPLTDTFVDLFCGGGAVTHCAMLSRKFKHFIMNDIDGRLPVLFKDCAYGKYTIKNHSEWIDRNAFHKMKDTDAYIALVWSFGNNGKDYIYGADIEPFKRDYHKAVYSNDTSLLEPYGYKIKPSDKQDVYERYLEFNRQIKEIVRSDLDSLVRQIEIERLQSLQSLQSLDKDYRDVDIPAGAVIYCDIPYTNTNCGKYSGFNHYDFYEWAVRQDNIYISEYQMPEHFVPIAKIDKRVLSAANGNSGIATEYLFTNQRTYNSFTDDRKQMVKIETARQMNLFDFIGE